MLYYHVRRVNPYTPSNEITDERLPVRVQSQHPAGTHKIIKQMELADWLMSMSKQRLNHLLNITLSPVFRALFSVFRCQLDLAYYGTYMHVTCVYALSAK